MGSVIDWRWRELFNLLSIATRNEQEAKDRTQALLRAKLRTDKEIENAAT